MSRRPIIRSLVVAAGAGLLALSTAGPAAAETVGQPLTCLAAGILDGYGSGTLWIQHINTSGVVDGTTSAPIASL